MQLEWKLMLTVLGLALIWAVQWRIRYFDAKHKLWNDAAESGRGTEQQRSDAANHASVYGLFGALGWAGIGVIIVTLLAMWIWA